MWRPNKYHTGCAYADVIEGVVVIVCVDQSAFNKESSKAMGNKYERSVGSTYILPRAFQITEEGFGVRIQYPLCEMPNTKDL